MTEPFVHLHCHSEYSLLDGLSRISELVTRAAELEQPAVALTDHGAMYGTMEFYRAARKTGVKPIIGIESYMAERRMQDRHPQKDKERYHLLLLAQNQTGYQNLLRLASKAQLEGFYYKPRLDKKTLEEHSEGLICTTGCLAAEVPRRLNRGQKQQALEDFRWYLDVFGRERFFVELQQHDIPELKRVNTTLLEWAKSHEVGLVATNDVHYVRREDAEPHDVLLCVQTGKQIDNGDRMQMSDDSYYLKSYAEMERMFGDVPEALRNTVRIAEMCNVDLETDGYHLPPFDVPEGHTPETYLRELTERGLRRRYGADAETAEVRQRMEHELKIIHEMGFDTYFLIVWDLCRFARENDIWWNVRGSGAGSIVAYCLGITGIDPLENDLIFERFLNPGRVSMPDIDMDFPDDQRAQMMEYTVEKYGAENVAQIITFGTMGARAAIRDVGRAMGMPVHEVDRIAKLVPSGPKVKLDDAFENAEFVQAYEQDPEAKQLVDTAKSLEGLSRHASTHAAGVIISDKPLVEYCPLHRPTKGEQDESGLGVVTQWPMEILESIGLLKVDFLGLSTITIMRKACELIEERHGIRYDLSNIPYKRRPDDPDTDAEVKKLYDLLSSGETTGVFQVESAGMRDVLRNMRPREFEHIIAAISLYRPGPMEYIPDYIRRMHGEDEVTYRHPKLEPILEETFGITVYQEQIIQIASELAGYAPGDADLMRRAVSKKKAKEIAKHKKLFIKGCVENDIARTTAEEIYGDIEYFARYGFNKCVPGDVEVVDAVTGRLVRVEDLYNGNASIEQTLSCDTEQFTLRAGEVTAVYDNGVKPVYRLTTASGRRIEATANHPFFTFDGWRTLGDLTAGDLIATPRRIPVKGNAEWPDHEVIVLGHLLAEGNLCHPHSVYFYSQDEEQRDDYVRAAEQFANVECTVSMHRTTFSVYAKRCDRTRPPGIVTWAKDLGLWGKRADEKEIPAAAFELKNRQLALLVSRLWEGDGHINTRDRSLYYATASERLAHQVQHVLLRLGIVSRIRTVEFPYKDGRTGYQVFVTGNDNLAAFADTVAPHFVSDARRADLLSLILTEPSSMGTKDIVPLGVKTLVRAAKAANGLTWNEINAACGIAQREFSPSNSPTKTGFTRETIGRLSDFFDDDDLRCYAESDIYWDKVLAIEYVGEKRTYDITVADVHNFVANDIIVHNSHAADYAVITCQTAYLKAHYPVEFITALLAVERDNSDKVSLFVAEARRLGIEVLPPDINKSDVAFTIEPNPEAPADLDEDDPARWAIRFGMGAIKNVGEAAVEQIIVERDANGPFADVDDFCRRVDLRQINRRVMECLIKAGCFDELVEPQLPEAARETLLEVLDRLMGLSAEVHAAAEVGQTSMFDMLGAGTGTQSGSGLHGSQSILATVPSVKANPKQCLQDEKELLGLYISDHPLQRVGEALGDRITAECSQITAEHAGQQVVVAGLIKDVRTITTRNGDPMAFVQLEDLHGDVDVVVFPRTYEASRQHLKEDRIVLVAGRVDVRNDSPSVLADKIDPFEQTRTERTSSDPADGKATWASPQDTATSSERPPTEQPSNGSPDTSLRDGVEHVVQITFRRTGEDEADMRRFQRTIEALQSSPGDDRVVLTMIVPPDDREIVLNFPKLRTGFTVNLKRYLESEECGCQVEAKQREETQQTQRGGARVA